MLDREEERILVETGEALATTGGAEDPEGTLIRGFQVFLEAAPSRPTSTASSSSERAAATRSCRPHR